MNPRPSPRRGTSYIYSEKIVVAVIWMDTMTANETMSPVDLTALTTDHT